MIQRQQVAVGAAILNSENQLLFVKRSATEEFLPGLWEIPGGGTEFGETPQFALQREILEECGVEIEVGVPVSVDEYYIETSDEKIQRVEITFLCTLSSEEQTVRLSDEHDEYSWRSLDNLQDLEITEYMSTIVSKIKASTEM